eukprot:2800688-Pleurochrysis_carterae.AAC.2
MLAALHAFGYERPRQIEPSGCGRAITHNSPILRRLLAEPHAQVRVRLSASGSNLHSGCGR